MSKKFKITIILCLIPLLLFTSCQSENEKIINLDLIKSLSEKKDDLTWKDFDGYPFEVIGFGSYIRKYTVEDNYHLLISGTSVNDKPRYIYLVKPSGERIDIRYDDIDQFLLE
ncbi:hypothetical protein D3C76_570220 [compost metagenome]